MSINCEKLPNFSSVWRNVSGIFRLIMKWIIMDIENVDMLVSIRKARKSVVKAEISRKEK